MANGKKKFYVNLLPAVTSYPMPFMNPKYSMEELLPSSRASLSPAAKDVYDQLDPATKYVYNVYEVSFQNLLRTLEQSDRNSTKTFNTLFVSLYRCFLNLIAVNSEYDQLF